MKIATMVRGYLTAPRPKDMVYAPIDLAVAISEGLVKLGHKADYFGPSGSQLRAGVETLGLRPLVHNHDEFQTLLENPDLLMHAAPNLWDLYFAREMFTRAQAGEYDVLHFHHPETAMPYVKLFPDVPVVYTLHEPLSPWFTEVLKMHHTPNQFYVSISDNQRKMAPELPYVATVHNGIDTKLFGFSDDHNGYLLSVGRVTEEKGVREAIQVAQKTNNRLLIIGPVYYSAQGYFDKYVKPHLNDKIKYLGFVAHEELVEYFKRAKAFLMPNQWEEPFGLTMIEAMACGTPVVALRRGSIPEVVENGKTGYVVDSLDEMVTAVKNIDVIKPIDCRKRVEEKFSNEIMVAAYERVYQKILKRFAAKPASLAH